jgi:hypothetical protein
MLAVALQRDAVGCSPADTFKSGNLNSWDGHGGFICTVSVLPGLTENPRNKLPGGKISRMERELCFGQQKIRFDREATAGLYRDLITVPGSELCTCISCKNFAAQRTNVFPEEFLGFLKELGVDPPREWEAFDYDFGPENPRIHLYGGWFLFCGELIGGFDRQCELSAGTFAHSFTASFPASTLPKEVKLCAVEFLARIPWILPENPESSAHGSRC